MFQESENITPGTWAGWSTISPQIHLISYLEQHSYLAPLCEDIESDDEEIAIIKTRLQAMGYLD